MPFAQVAFNIPVDQIFDYSIPPSLLDQTRIGQRVRVPFRNQIKTGCVVGILDTTSSPYVKSIISCVDLPPLLTENFIQLARWIADYYFCSIGQALSVMLPPSVRKKTSPKGIITVELVDADKDLDLTPAQSRIIDFLRHAKDSVRKAEVLTKTGTSSTTLDLLESKGLIKLKRSSKPADTFEEFVEPQKLDFELTPDQMKALDLIDHCWQVKDPKVILIHGVTGSGKTEIYIRCIQKLVSQGRSAIVLVPEIALTPQTVARFKSRFDRVSVLHSYLTPGDRAKEWFRTKEGQVDVVIGVRSAVFAPLKNLGAIVIDEEQENTYKEHSAPRYHAREVALKRAELEDCLVILGSATPSLESYYNAKSGRYVYTQLPKRVAGQKLPEIQVVDMLAESTLKKRTGIFSRALLDNISESLSRNDQVILFLNRRGFATVARCRRCGHVIRCRRCMSTLAYHKNTDSFICHYCMEQKAFLQICPECGARSLKMIGIGTERVEAEARKHFQNAKIHRMDSDAMKTRSDYRFALKGLWSGDLNIMIGTQMIAKGLDVPNVTLVGVISADTAFYLPDFRSSERTFQLIMQVAGRAGRGPKGGKVIVQTINPTHYSIICACTYNYDGFVQKELALREDLGYPPFTKLIRIIVESQKEDQAKTIAEEIHKQLQGAITDKILGPHPAPLYKMKGRFRVHLLVKLSNDQVRPQLKKLLFDQQKTTQARLIFDADPVSLY